MDRTGPVFDGMRNIYKHRKKFEKLPIHRMPRARPPRHRESASVHKAVELIGRGVSYPKPCLLERPSSSPAGTALCFFQGEDGLGLGCATRNRPGSATSILTIYFLLNSKPVKHRRLTKDYDLLSYTGSRAVQHM